MNTRTIASATIALAAAVSVCTAQSDAAVVTFTRAYQGQGKSIVEAFATKGYDLYSTLPPTLAIDRSGTGAFSAGDRQTSLPPSWAVGSAASSGAYSFAHGLEIGYPIINVPQLGPRRLGVTYISQTSAFSQPKDILTLTIGSTPGTDVFVGVMTNGGNDRDLPDRVRVRQVNGGAGDSGEVSVLQTPIGHWPNSIQLLVFKIAGAKSGDRFTISGSQSTPQPNGRDFNAPIAGLLLSESGIIGCIGDFNSDSEFTFDDFDQFVREFERGSLSADVNNDGFLDFTDFDAFVQAFSNGC